MVLPVPSKMYEMFTQRTPSAYAIAPNYTYQAGYAANYSDTCTVNATSQLSNTDNVQNGNYTQNMPNSWPVYVSNAARQQGLYDDLLPIHSNHYNINHYQNQPISCNGYHLQRNSADIASANFSIQGSSSMDGHDGFLSNRTDGHPSPESAVALSSDGGLSGTESPELSLHINHNNAGVICRPQPARSPYEWMTRSSYQNQPNPGKTRTKDKYRVVYSDHQRLELEKEFHYSRYITIRRKSELANVLGLSERQVKIWFQNRRAKERKLAKKREEIDQKNKDVILHQTNAINISSLNFTLRPLSHFDHDNNSRSISMFQNGDHLCK